MTPNQAKKQAKLAPGYYDHDTMQRILDWCDVSHPVFGREIPTPEEAVEAGKRFAPGEMA